MYSLIINYLYLGCLSLCMQIFLKSGLKIKALGKTFAIDSNGKADYHLISHAHSDHVPKADKVLCSPETASLIMHRYTTTMKFKHQLNGIELLNSGHILGSRSFFIQDGSSVLYTGDFSNKNRLFLKKAQLKKADNLIIETTFGTPTYSFPDQEQELLRARSWIEQTLQRNSVLLLGYSLGKAQLISKTVEDLNTYAHSSVQRMNSAYNFLGVKINDLKTLDLNKVNDENFIYILPPHLMRTLGKGMKKKFNMKTAVFSGWAANPFYTWKLGADKGFVLSDHADFKGLLETVRTVSPNRVYTLHGFSQQFADELESLGYETTVLG